MPEPPATFRCGHPRTRTNTLVQSPAYATCRQCSQQRRKARELLGPATTPAYQQWHRAYVAALPVNHPLLPTQTSLF